MEEWEILVTDARLAWFDTLDRSSQALITDAIDRLAEAGPHLGRPLVDRIKGSELHNLKELRKRRPAAARSGSCSSSILDARQSC